MPCLNRPTRLAALVAVLACLAACGGKSDDTAAASQGAASGAAGNQVTGIGTASGVSVVTAKNAQ